MSTVTFKGTPVNVAGTLPAVGNPAPSFELTAADLTEKTAANFAGRKIVFNIFPSLDTGTCAKSVRAFNERASELENTVVLCVSADLPFAQSRFCGAEGLEEVIPLSTFRHPEFLEQWGVSIADGPLAGLAARTVVVVDETGVVTYVQQVPEIADEPDYDAAIAALA